MNIAVSLLAAVGLAVAGASGVPGVLRVWGAWAIVSGLVQLIVGVSRRTMGGQWPMILSGGISVLAGWSFIAGASAANPSLTNVAGYAVLGGIFFLISALRLGRAAKGKLTWTPLRTTSSSSARARSGRTSPTGWCRAA